MDDPPNTRVLVIDDDAAVRDSYALILRPRDSIDPAVAQAARTLFGDAGRASTRRPGFELDFAADGLEGVARVAAAVGEGAPYAVVFCDVRMPGIDGVATVERLRAIDPRAEVVFVTAHHDWSIEEIVARTGSDVTYLVKPFTFEEIYQLATRLVLEWNRARWAEWVAKERLRAERLLHLLVPAAIARRVQAGEGEIADAVHGTVLFADVVGFTVWSGALPPIEVLRVLRALFEQVGASADRHRVRRIRLMGDGYMAATGLTPGERDHEVRMVRHALDVVALVQQMRSPDGAPIRVRVGVHTGEMVAGVLSPNDPRFDLWGATVSIAARLESHGEAGRVHVSDAVARAIAADFVLEERGTIALKGVGPMRSWWVSAPGGPRSA